MKLTADHVVAMQSELAKTMILCQYAHNEGPVDVKQIEALREMMHEATIRFQGNRPDDAVSTWADYRLIVAGILRHCLRIVEGE